MTANHAHTPTTRDIRMAYVDSISRNNPNDYGDDRAKEISAEFFRWLTAHEESIREEEREGMAAAEQREAIKALRDAAESPDLIDHMYREYDDHPLRSTLAPAAVRATSNYLHNRADRLEGDDEQV